MSRKLFISLIVDVIKTDHSLTQIREKCSSKMNSSWLKSPLCSMFNFKLQNWYWLIKRLMWLFMTTLLWKRFELIFSAFPLMIKSDLVALDFITQYSTTGLNLNRSHLDHSALECCLLRRSYLPDINTQSMPAISLLW